MGLIGHIFGLKGANLSLQRSYTHNKNLIFCNYWLFLSHCNSKSIIMRNLDIIMRNIAIIIRNLAIISLHSRNEKQLILSALCWKRYRDVL